MGLIARQLEAAGIPTLSMSSARTITAAVNPPRAAFLDYPLGHTTGKANEPEERRAILHDALSIFETATSPGTIVDLDYRWSDNDSWKQDPMGARRGSKSGIGDGAPADDGEARQDTRIGRSPTPVYQTPDDEQLAASRSSADQCLVCVGIDPAHTPA